MRPGIAPRWNANWRRAPRTLILLDCYLPGLSAAEIAALLGRSAGTRLALMSVNADDIATAQTLNAAFIYKGALPEEVLATLKTLIPA